MTRVLLALGSNVGDRDRYLASAREALAKSGVSLVRQSQVAETAPIGVTDQPSFFNQVLEGETNLEPRALLATVKQIERDLGRQPRQRWGPREIDIDILRYDELIVDEPGLRIPHPELNNRPFLLDLIQEIEGK
jgi:2-amino-4-hydroxy-6-hydroxymethyldihydropteridine diphosphokinase